MVCGGSQVRSEGKEYEPPHELINPPLGRVAVAKYPSGFFADLAEVYARYGMHVEANKLLRYALSKEPEARRQTEYKIKLAESLESTNEIDQAKQIWVELTRDANPVVVTEAKIHIAAKLANDGQIMKAIDQFEEVALESPVKAFRDAAAVQLARLLLSEGTHQKRMARYRERLNKDPGNDVLLTLVLNLLRDDPKAHVEVVRAIVSALPGEPDLQIKLADMLVEVGELAEAEQVLRKLKSNHPDQQQSTCERLARVAVQLGKPSDAKAFMDESVSEMPDGFRKSLHLARECLKLGVSDAAEEYGRKAYGSAEGDALKAAAAMELGDALFRLNRFDEAATLLRPLAEQDLWVGLKSRAKEMLSQLK